MSRAVTAVCDQLVEAILSVHDDSQPEKAKYVKIRDNFLHNKRNDNTNFRVECALKMAKHYSNFVRKFAFELFVRCLRYERSRTDFDHLDSIRGIVLDFLSVNCDLVAGWNDLKELLSKLTVELMIKDWPTLWNPNFFDIAGKGPVQTELVICTFLELLRVRNSGVGFYRVSKERIDRTLSMTTDEMYVFLRDTVNRCYRKSSANDDDVNITVIASSIKLMAEYARSFMSTKYFNTILSTLSTVLEDDRFFVDTADCLIGFMRKTYTLNDRKYFVRNLFISNFIERLHDLVMGRDEYSNVLKLSELLSWLNLFLRKLSYASNMLRTMFDDVRCYRSLNVHVRMTTSLLRHRSYRVVYNGTLAWKQLLENQILKDHPLILNSIPTWIKSAIGKLSKIPYYNVESDNFDEYRTVIRYEFQTEEQYCKFYDNFRHELILLLCELAKISPSVMFDAMNETINRCLREVTSDLVPTLNKRLLWSDLKLLTQFVLMAAKRLVPSTTDRLLRSIDSILIRRISRYPLVLTDVLKCIGYIVDYFDDRQYLSDDIYLDDIVDGIFYCLDFPHSSEYESLIVANKVRRSAGNLLLKLTVACPNLMTTFFDRIYDKYLSYFESTMSCINQSVAINLIQALVSLNNYKKNFNLQSQFLKSITLDTARFWTSNAFLNDDEFYLDDRISDDDINKRRSRLLFNVEATNAILCFSSYPNTTEECQNGGFEFYKINNNNRNLFDHASIISSGSTRVLTNPCVSHIIPLLPSLLALMKRLNSSYTLNMNEKLSGDYRDHLAITDYETRLLNRVYKPEKYDESIYVRLHRTTAESDDLLRNYLATLYEMVVNSLSISIHVLMNDIFESSIIKNWIGALFDNLDRVPDYRLTWLLKYPLEFLILHCPPSEQDAILIPLLETIAVHMVERMKIRWKLMNDFDAKTNIDQSSNGIDRYVISNLITTYAEVLRILLSLDFDSICRCASSYEANNVEQLRLSVSRICLDEAMEKNLWKISEVGLKLLENSTIRLAMLNFYLNFTTCGLRPSCLILRILSAVIRYMHARRLLDADLVERYSNGLLYSAKTFTFTDSSYFAVLTIEFLQTYQTLRPEFPILFEILSNNNNNNSDNLSARKKYLNRLTLFDHKILNETIERWGQKGRLKMLRKLIPSRVR